MSNNSPKFEVIGQRPEAQIEHLLNALSEILKVVSLTFDGDGETYSLGKRWNHPDQKWQELKVEMRWQDA